MHDADARKRRIHVGSTQVAADASAYGGTWGADSGLATIAGEADGTSEGNAAYRFDGRIDDVRVYAQPLSAEQLAEVAAGSNPTVAGAGASAFAVRWTR